MNQAGQWQAHMLSHKLKNILTHTNAHTKHTCTAADRSVVVGLATVLRMFHNEEGSVKVMSPSQGCVKSVSHLVQVGRKHCTMDNLQGGRGVCVRACVCVCVRMCVC